MQQSAVTNKAKVEQFLSLHKQTINIQYTISYLLILYYNTTNNIQQSIGKRKIMKNIKLYRVEDSNGNNPQLVNSQNTLSYLYEQMYRIRQHQDFQIYYHFRSYPLSTHGHHKLKDIVAIEPTPSPTFVVFDLVTDAHCPLVAKYGLAVSQLMKNAPGEAKDYSVGENGVVIFDDRRISVLASSVNEVTKKQEYDMSRKQIIKGFNNSIIEANKAEASVQQGLIKKVLLKLGIIKQDLTSKTLISTIAALKNIKTTDDVKSHIEREYSDYDPKFAAYLQSIYLKYALLNHYHLHYVEYKQLSDGVIKYKFSSQAKIAIIGDYGTGLSDSIGLLSHIILQMEADIILHLGDVYYAGTPEQYKKHVMEPLNALRKEAGRKFKKNVLFYSIPGNHDYYTWGLPFLTFIANVNEVKQITQEFIKPKQPQDNLLIEDDPDQYKQSSSYFCLQSQDSRWQFIGLDTAYHDSNPTNQINGASLGPRLRQKQVQWFTDKMQHFPGSTILLTHHQLYSIHDRICGTLSQYKVFSCINPLLSAQLFKYLPNISAWFWGHQHSVMFFDEDVLGVRKCRLLGNSSFHVFQKEGPYLRKKGFPNIPLIEDDQKYVHKYLPLNPEPDQKNPDCYYNLTYALIDFGKQILPAQSVDPFTSTLKVQYWCCPCYPEEEAKKKHFTPYLMLEQPIQPRINTNLITSQKYLKNPHDFVGNIQQVKEGSEVWIKCQIGLFAEDGVKLGICGNGWRIRIYKSSNDELANCQSILYIDKKQERISNQEKKEQEIHKQKVETKLKQAQNNNCGRLILDGDYITFDQVKHIHKSCSMQDKIQKPFGVEVSENLGHVKMQSNPSINLTFSQNIISKQPVLQPIMSIDSELESSQNSGSQSQPALAAQPNPSQLPSLLPTTKFEIKKHRILKDISLHIKYGDAFTLRDIKTGYYLSVHVGIYGGILRLTELKKGEEPCLFMFLKGSKVKADAK